MDSLFPGGIPLAEGTKLIPLMRPNSCCGAVEVRAWYLPGPNIIKAECTRCLVTRNLPHDTYAHHFELLRKKAKKKKNGHGDPNFTARNRMAIFERDGYRCVYCESNERARERRSEILSQIRQPNVGSKLSLEIPEQSVRDALQMTQLSLDFAYEFFGLVPDHIIPRSVSKRIQKELSPKQFDFASKEWLVTACVECNSDRKDRFIDAHDLISVYVRWIFSDRRKSESERLAELHEFIEVVRIVRTHISRNESNAESQG